MKYLRECRDRAQARMAMAHSISNKMKKKEGRENRGVVFQAVIQHP